MASNSQTISLENLIFRSYASYALVEKFNHLDQFDTVIIPDPTPDQIITTVNNRLKFASKLERSEVDVSFDATAKLDRLNIDVTFSCPENTFYNKITVVTNPENVRKIGAYLCKLREADIISCKVLTQQFSCDESKN